MMNKKFNAIANLSLAAVLGLSLLVVETAQAAVYKTTDIFGRVEYSSTPPIPNAKPVELGKKPSKKNRSRNKSAKPAADNSTAQNNNSAPSSPSPSAKPSSPSQKGFMPFVDNSKNMVPAVGFNDLRILPSTKPKYVPNPGDGDGQFRIDCEPSHMSNDDPLLYPNQKGASPHNIFFGNTSIVHNSNLDALSTTGNSTCRGGIANRSAYWLPSVVDTATNTALVPSFALWYYKTGYAINKDLMTVPPKGLRMTAGNSKATNADQVDGTSFNCLMPDDAPSPPATRYIPACPKGGKIVVHVGFKQCWDGKNLDSLDHKSHMSGPVKLACPATHPIAIPHLGLNIWYRVTSDEGTKNWRLSSDNYPTDGYNAGYSSHASWVNGWDETQMNKVVKQCLHAGVDCGNNKLGYTPGVGYEFIYLHDKF